MKKHHMILFVVFVGLLVWSDSLAQRPDTGFVTTDPISLAQFKDLFNQDAGMPGLVLLLSPTYGRTNLPT